MIQTITSNNDAEVLRQSTTRDIILQNLLLIDCFNKWCYICPFCKFGTFFFSSYKVVIGFRSPERLGRPIAIGVRPSSSVVMRQQGS